MLIQTIGGPFVNPRKAIMAVFAPPPAQAVTLTFPGGDEKYVITRHTPAVISSIRVMAESWLKVNEMTYLNTSLADMAKLIVTSDGTTELRFYSGDDVIWRIWDDASIKLVMSHFRVMQG